MAEIELEYLEQVETEPLRLISLEELLAMGDARVEIINGEVKHMSPVGGLHHIIEGNLIRILDNYVVANGIGIVFMDGLIYLMHSEARGLKDSFVPDVSFIRSENIPANWQIEKPFPGVPDLAVEVMSPEDKANEVEAKAQTYLQKGTQEVWIIYPDTQSVHQYRSSQPDTIRIYSGSKQIDTVALFPELQLSTDTIFNLPAWARPGTAKLQTDVEQTVEQEKPEEAPKE
jgi:Uma2 family endonuclease